MFKQKTASLVTATVPRRWRGATLVALVALAAQAHAQLAETPVTEDPQVITPPAESHASRQAERSIVLKAADEPELFRGKTVVLSDGRTVGEIQDVRRRLENLELYLVVDATAYYNAPAIQAIPVNDIITLEEDRVIMAEHPGMHVRGFTYHAEEFTEADDYFPREAVEDELEGENPPET